MKFKTTQRAVKAGYDKVISIPYCGLQSLLRFRNVAAYTTRREGWGADIYDFGTVAIVTGYSPFGNVEPPYEVYHKYDQQAEIINASMRYEEKREALDKLLQSFLSEVTGNDITL